MENFLSGTGDMAERKRNIFSVYWGRHSHIKLL
jgi:hypothetical protein